MEIITKQVDNKPLTVTIEYPHLDEYTEGIIKKVKALNVTICGTLQDRTFHFLFQIFIISKLLEEKLFSIPKMRYIRQIKNSMNLKKCC